MVSHQKWDNTDTSKFEYIEFVSYICIYCYFVQLSRLYLRFKRRTRRWFDSAVQCTKQQMKNNIKRLKD